MSTSATTQKRAYDCDVNVSPHPHILNHLDTDVVISAAVVYDLLFIWKECTSTNVEKWSKESEQFSRFRAAWLLPHWAGHVTDRRPGCGESILVIAVSLPLIIYICQHFFYVLGEY